MNLLGRGRKGDSYSPYKSRKFLFKTSNSFTVSTILCSFRFATAIIAQQAFRPFIPRHPVLTGSVTSIPTITNVIICKSARAQWRLFLHLSISNTSKTLRAFGIRGFSRTSRRHRQNNEPIPSDERNSRTKISSTSKASQCFQPRRKRLSISLDPKR